MNLPERPLFLLLAALFSLSSASSAFAWHGDIRYFHRHDIGLWRGGRWVHGWHGGRVGWWWFTAGSWYFYTRPMYPYPDPYVPSTIVVEPAVVQPQIVTAQPPVMAPQPPVSAPPPPPMAPAAAPVAATPQYWYSCNKPKGFYPYIASCPGGWTPVPATPPQQ